MQQSVTYRFTPSGTRQTKLRTVTGEEFLRGFLQHTLPRGLQKVRHYGWLSPNHRLALAEVKWLVWLFLGWTYWLASGYAPQREADPRRVPTCPACGGAMRIAGMWSTTTAACWWSSASPTWRADSHDDRHASTCYERFQTRRRGRRSLPVCAEVTKGLIERPLCRSSTERIVAQRSETGTTPIIGRASPDQHPTSRRRIDRFGEPLPIAGHRSLTQPGFLNRGLELRLEDSRSQSLTCSASFTGLSAK